ncbi:MAG: glycosyltransferase family 4 protein [Candidatus Brocadiaceae bacterium]|nr:glycosyltransferase family 4 protein [Candidatus Brocadiaceae bacterium]
MKQKVEKLFPEKNAYVLNNPVDLQKMIPSRNYIRNDNSLVFLGWFIEAKGVFDIVDAIELVVRTNKKIHLDFYGTKEIEALKSYIQKKKLIKYITVHGWIDDTNKVEVLSKSTCLVLPSHSEGIPNVILEAMATKTPIISTLVGGIREVLSAGHSAVIAKAKDPQDLSKKINQLLADPDLRNTISQNAFHDVKSKYDVNVIKKEFVKIINNTLL